MENYKIDYEILNYTKYHNRLNRIINNPNNRFEVHTHSPLGQSTCGFPIEHYSIGKGWMHIVYMAGTHGNEIISVDYITQLMENIALGNGGYQDFDPNLFTLDFIPCQNPEGFFTTTYALDYLMKEMDSLQIEKFCKRYWFLYREDDINVKGINIILTSFCNDILKEENVYIVEQFWNENKNNQITPEHVISFLSEITKKDVSLIREYIIKKWHEILEEKESIPAFKYHQRFFKGVSLDCIPVIDEKHKKLKKSLEKIYQKNKFPIETLANFFANGNGVNLNDNNKYLYNIYQEKRTKGQNIYGNLRENNLLKSIPSPLGCPNYNLNQVFKYEPENEALLNYLESLNNQNENYAFFNIHSTGGLIYLYPVEEKDEDKAHKTGVTRDFKFYINNRIATEYTKEIGRVYKKYTSKYDPYKTMPFPDKITGIGDILRRLYPSSFMIELSKMGGNPIGPYGNKENNFTLTMIANMEANKKALKVIKEIAHLYNISYFMYYDEQERVHYEKKTSFKK